MSTTPDGRPATAAPPGPVTVVPVTDGGRTIGAWIVGPQTATYRPVVDLTRLAGLVAAGAAAVAIAVAAGAVARHRPAVGTVTMGPGGWVSMKGGVMAVRPARRAWRRTRPAATGPLPRRPWWARLLAATTLESVLG